jgi:hypothetical protein
MLIWFFGKNNIQIFVLSERLDVGRPIMLLFAGEKNANQT